VVFFYDFFEENLADPGFFGNLYNVNTTPSKLPKNSPIRFISNLFSSDHPYESHSSFTVIFIFRLISHYTIMSVAYPSGLRKASGNECPKYSKI
jgi:hypothetical protein